MGKIATKKLVVQNEEFFAEVVRLLKEGHKATIPCKGNSMLPTIRSEKDLVVLQACGSYKPKDIVLFTYNGKYILHRIISQKGENFVMRGDGNPYGTEHCKSDEVYAKVTEIIRNGKKSRNPYSKKALIFLYIWDKLLPIRKYLIAIYRKLPWN